MQITHTCQSCNEVMAVHEHASYQEIKDCLRGMKALCPECSSWPGCDSLTENQAVRTSIPSFVRI